MTPELYDLAGLRLVLDPDPAAQTVAAGAFVGIGARDEAPAQLGLSHFLEHLMFKGSERVSAAALNEWLDDLGGYSNAFTAEEMTVYHIAALPERLTELLEALRELLHPALRAEDIETERGVILEEIAMYAEQPVTQVMEALHADYWGTHPLGHSVLGTPQTVASLSQKALQQHLAGYRAATVLVVSGQFEPLAVLDWVRQHWPAASLSLAGRGAVPVLRAPLQPAGAVRQIEAPLERTQVALAWPGVAAGGALRSAANVLAELIGGDNGLLYWALLDSGLADSADFGHLEFRECGVFEGGFSCDAGRGEEVLAAYQGALESARPALNPAALARTQRKLAVATLARTETPQGRLFALGLEMLMSGELLTPPQQVARIQAVTLPEVQQVLEALLEQPPTGVILGRRVAGRF